MALGKGGHNGQVYYQTLTGSCTSITYCGGNCVCADETSAGSLAAMMLGPEATTEEIEQLAEQMGLKEPILKQITEWFRNVIKGDLGKSIFLRMPVTKAIYQHLEATLLLTLLALVVAVTVGISAGVIAAALQQPFGSADHEPQYFRVAIPVFWLGLMLILKVALPSSFSGGQLRPGSAVRNGGLHAVSNTTSHFFECQRSCGHSEDDRANMLEVLQSDYVEPPKLKVPAAWRLHLNTP